MNDSKLDSLFGATTSSTNPDLDQSPRDPLPGLFLAWRQGHIECSDRSSLQKPVIVGRSPEGWCVPDRKLSRTHFSIQSRGSKFIVEDLGSRNGVFIDGTRIESAREVVAGAVIRAGSCLFVTVDDLTPLMTEDIGRNAAMAGRFYTPKIIHDLRVAARTKRHVLLAGETGTGKELAAAELHQVWRELERSGELVALNAARFGTEADAVGELFGIEPKSYTDVKGRLGSLERAHGGTLFLDEVHNLPLRVQRSLLRFAEDGRLRPLGSSREGRQVDVRLILGTNRSVRDACQKNTLADDLVARCHRVTIPPLRARRADIPDIFLDALERASTGPVIDRITGELRASHLERISQAQIPHNVRDLQDLAAVMTARVEEGESPASAIRSSLDQAFGPAHRVEARACGDGDEGDESPLHSRYERHRSEIISTYHEVGRNISHLEATLCERGISVTRKWLSIYLERWGERKIKRRARR